jgi:hypothetical protein
LLILLISDANLYICNPYFNFREVLERVASLRELQPPFLSDTMKNPILVKMRIRKLRMKRVLTPIIPLEMKMKIL